MRKSNIFNLVMSLMIFSCSASYIDEIIPIDAGPDMEDPEININFPTSGTQIRVPEDETPINIDFEVRDDIEIQSIRILLNQTEIASFTDFLDYRRVILVHRHENLGNGPHILTIEAVDIAGKLSSETVNFEKVEPYTPVYENEVFYLPFDGDVMELISTQNASIQGSPTFVNGISGRAYQGTANAYLTFPTAGLLHEEFSAVFWYKVNASPNRAGILTISPPDTNNPENMNNRTSGFRLFREAAGSMQRIKLNVGNGSADNWFDGGAAADINPAAGEWVHVAITLTQTTAAVYINGLPVSQGTFPGVDWTGTNLLSIGSGAPRFTEWGHLSDASAIDELRLFSKALSAQEILGIMQTERP
ncbi:LamG domain-containing protein [Anditalea andensis]|uniref:LamG domain-containing protein n=1 Tax=Anditalea andensis TaxID=1048983 RepID=UPI000553DC37|nr:LamG domain-containing protein [Anditalea andensis]